MAALVWDAIGERLYETGTKKGVLYPQVAGAYPAGVAWNGLTAVTESPDGAEPTDLWADDIKYLSIRSVENYKGTIEAYTFPDEFAECDGSATLMAGVTIGQQPRKPFGFSWVTTIGNDTEYDDYGYKIHLVWNATASPSEKSYQTVNDSPEAITFSWEIDTTPTNVTGHKPTAHMEIHSTKFTTSELKAKLQTLEAVLWGRNAADAQAATYKKATGTYQATGIDYYTKDGDVYTKVTTPSESDFDEYYVVDKPATDAVTAITPHLPTPDDVFYILENGQERAA